MAKKAGLFWQDAQGERQLNVVTTASGVGGIETALEAASNAVVGECFEGLDEFYGSLPSTGDYPTVRVNAVLYFRDDATGSMAKLFLPAPQSGILIGDTVDPSNSLVIAIITAAVGSLLAGSGNPVTSYVGGELIKTRFSAIASS